MTRARFAPATLLVLACCLLADVCVSRHADGPFRSVDAANPGFATGREVLQYVNLAAGSQPDTSNSMDEATKKASGEGLPTVGEGQPCGAEVGICSGNLCCSQDGVCGASIDFCGYGCRDNFGKCFIVAGTNPTPTPSTTGTARPAPKAAKSKGGLSTPMIIIIAGAAAGGVLILVIALLLLRRCRQTADDSEATKEASAVLTKDPGNAGEIIDDSKGDKDQTCCVSFFCGIAPEQTADGTITAGAEDKSVELQNTSSPLTNVVAPPPSLVIPLQASAPALFSPTSTTGLLSPGAYGGFGSAQLSGALFSPSTTAPGGLLSPSAALLSPNAALLSPSAALLSPISARAAPAVGSDAPKPAAGQRRNLFAEALAQLDGLDASLKSPGATPAPPAQLPPAPVPSAPAAPVRASQDSLAAAAATTLARAPELLTRSSCGDETDDETAVKYVHIIKEDGLTSIHSTTSTLPPNDALHSGAYCPACSYGSCTIHAPRAGVVPAAPAVTAPTVGLAGTRVSGSLSESSETRSAGLTTTTGLTTTNSTTLGATFELMQRGNANTAGDVPMAPSTPKQPNARTYTSQDESDTDRDTVLSSRELATPLSITIIPSRPKSPGANYSSGRSPHHAKSPGRPKSPYHSSSSRSPHHHSRSPRHHSYSTQPRSPAHPYPHQHKSPGRHQPRSPHHSYAHNPHARQPKSPAAHYTSRDLSPAYVHPSRPKSPGGGAPSARSISPARSSSATGRSHSPARSTSSRSESPSGTVPVIRSNPAFRGPAREPGRMESGRMDSRLDRSPFSRDMVRPNSKGDLTRDEYFDMRTTPPRTRAAGKSAERRRGMVLGADDSDNADDLGFFMPNPAGSGGMGVRR